MTPTRDIELKHDVGGIILRPVQVGDAEAFYEAARLSMGELMPWMD